MHKNGKAAFKKLIYMMMLSVTGDTFVMSRQSRCISLTQTQLRFNWGLGIHSA